MSVAPSSPLAHLRTGLLGLALIVAIAAPHAPAAASGAPTVPARSAVFVGGGAADAPVVQVRKFKRFGKRGFVHRGAPRFGHRGFSGRKFLHRPHQFGRFHRRSFGRHGLHGKQFIHRPGVIFRLRRH